MTVDYYDIAIKSIGHFLISPQLTRSLRCIEKYRTKDTDPSSVDLVEEVTDKKKVWVCRYTRPW